MGAACGTRPVARCLRAVRANQAAHSIRGAIDGVVDSRTDDHHGGDERIRHVDLHQAVPVVVDATPIRAADTHQDALDDIAVVSQRVVQAASHVIRQRSRDRRSAALEFDIHVRTSWGRQGLAARPM
jgi:hypothetical protein